MTEERQPPRGRAPPTAARRRQHRCTPSRGSEGGRAQCMRGVRRHVYCPGDRSLFKRWLSPLAFQASRAKSPPTCSRVLPLRHGGWVPHVMRADPKREEGKPPHAKHVTASRLKAFSFILAETSGRKGGPPCKWRATAPRFCTLSTSSHLAVQHGGPGPHVM
jgi:hypothetical protein